MVGIDKINKEHVFNSATDVLIFTHIPKCGGTSLHSWLNYALQNRYLHFYPGSFERVDIDSLFGGGHQKFGLNPLSESNKNKVYITILRNPLDRYMSFFKHISLSEHHQLYPCYLDAHKEPLKFAKIIYEKGNDEISNLQTKMLSGNYASPNGKKTIDHINKYYSLVGCVEKMNDFYDKLSVILGVEKYDIPRLNVRKIDKEYGQLAKLNSFILDLNQEDMQVYDYYLNL